MICVIITDNYFKNYFEGNTIYLNLPQSFDKDKNNLTCNISPESIRE